MGQNTANTSKPIKPPSRAKKEAAKASTKDGQKVTRQMTNTRKEVREHVHYQQGR